MEPQEMRHIVALAARAPSIHNTQPWRFVPRDDVVELWTDPSRGLAVADPSGRARHVSCGAALLHLRVAAAGAGYATSVTSLPDAAEPDHLADVNLDNRVEPSFADSTLASAIASRRTVREPFAAGVLPPDVVAALHNAAEVEGCWLRIVDNPAEAAAVAVLLARADELERADPAYLDELRRWTGRSDDDSDGIPASAVPAVAPSARGSNYRLRDFVADRDDTSSGRSLDEPPAVERPLVAVLGTRDDDVISWLAAGQGLGRLLLAAATRGVVASPMTQPLEIPETRARLARELGVVGHPQMILRLGYDAAAAGDGAPATPRRSVREILTEEVPRD